jgi:uncharacterized protein with GYD domain
MATFVVFLSWTDQGIRSVKEASKRVQAGKDLAKKLGGEVKQVFLTSGESDLLVIVDAPNGDIVAKMALTISAQGNARTRMIRAWPEAEMLKMISELP